MLQNKHSSHQKKEKEKISFSQRSHVTANVSTTEVEGMYGLGIKTIVNLHTAYGESHCTVTPGILCKQKNA